MKLAAERQEPILAAVRARGTVRLSELVDKPDVTPVAVRRDVNALADRGLVVRVHGGILLSITASRKARPPALDLRPGRRVR